MADKKVFLYALSTCIWCRRTKELLTALGVDYDFVFVDTLQGAEKEKAVAEMARHNPSRSFPTVLINGTVIVGFQEARIRELLQK
ncbi:MAG: glutaredoxin family protein [Elusimicrobiaceae bacterium]|nr:glutaredoxin family protein [Elusimicrobiaceae bacterium]